MNKPTRVPRPSSPKRGSGPLAFFVALFIVALGSIQLVSSFHSYALNLSELNGLKRQESALIAKKQDLENDIARWNDKAYVTAQARERLGFVFPGEQAIRVEHPEAVTGDSKDGGSGESTSSDGQKALPWYAELSYAFKQADVLLPKTTTKGQGAGSSGNAASGSGAGDASGNAAPAGGSSGE
ncbi:FtsB family cell division protein [Bifidobacterium sp.]|nr:septum formation initiator family protein [Bifidobacterium sp.]MCH4209147.1 septum formation initiator family protein [Bifidobacterium sp.]MCI1224594.1 septum formation initiator family protein [Bifidobacterium sp.]